MNVLVIDVGGTHVKVRATGQKNRTQFASGPEMTAKKMVAAVRKIIVGWKYEAITIGYPGPVAARSYRRGTAQPRERLGEI